MKHLTIAVTLCLLLGAVTFPVASQQGGAGDPGMIYELNRGRTGFQNGAPVDLDKPGDVVNVQIANFKKYTARQKTTEWCWAACIQMAVNQREIEMSQEDVVKGVKGKLAIETASAAEINTFLNGWKLFDDPAKRWATNCFYMNSPPDPNMMFRQLGTMGRPVIVALTMPDEDEGTQHVVAIYKTTFVVGRDVTSIVVYDPYTGLEETLDWNVAKRRITTSWFPTVINNTYDRRF